LTFGSAVRFCPFIQISPLVGSYKPAMTRSRVVFPDPLVPIIAVILAVGMSKVMFLRICALFEKKLTFLSEIIGNQVKPQFLTVQRGLPLKAHHNFFWQMKVLHKANLH
jgi:hypothetical protein